MNRSLAGFLGASALLHAAALALAIPSPVRPRLVDGNALSVRLLRGFAETQRAAAVIPTAVETHAADPSSIPVAPSAPRAPALIPTTGEWAALADPGPLPVSPASAPSAVSSVAPESPAVSAAEPPPPTVPVPLAEVASPPPAPSRPAVQRIDVNASIARFRQAQQQLFQQGQRGQHLAWLRQRVADLMQQAVGTASTKDAQCTASVEGSSPVVSCDSAVLDAALHLPPGDLAVFLGKLVELDGIDGHVTFRWHAAASTFVQEFPMAEEPGAMTTASSASSELPSR